MRTSLPPVVDPSPLVTVNRRKDESCLYTVREHDSSLMYMHGKPLPLLLSHVTCSTRDLEFFLQLLWFYLVLGPTTGQGRHTIPEIPVPG